MPVEPLDTSQHDREAFKCGVEEVDRYFQAVARQAAQRHVAQTYVLTPPPPREEPCEVIGYYTLAQHSYRDSEMDATTARALKVKGLAAIPMILLGQLGVSKAHHGKGVGTALLQDALRRSLRVALTIGAVAVVTDPINDDAGTFYKKRGFNVLIAGEPRLIVTTRNLARYNPDIVNRFKNQSQPVEITFGSQQFLA